MRNNSYYVRTLSMSNDFLTTSEAATILKVTNTRIRQMILAGRLPSQKRGRDHFIRRGDLQMVKNRRIGRPKKSKEGGKIN